MEISTDEIIRSFMLYLIEDMIDRDQDAKQSPFYC